MSLVVQKYGGTSVADAQRLQAVAQRIAARRAQGDDLVVVVSAMGDTTDRLLVMDEQLSAVQYARELDLLLSTGEVVSCTLLAMALKALGVPAIALTGAQAGIGTDRRYGRARILRVDPSRILSHLQAGRVPVVAGFQGITDEMDITTLGRGGSDTTAVALAAALGAHRCEIYTDVEGIYTADPRLVPEARKLTRISYEEMLELASQGARVMHPRAVELGWAYKVPIYVASSFTEAPGTLICQEGESMEQRNRVMGIAHDTDVGRITIRGVPDRPGIAAAIFGPLAEAGISVDTIVQNASVERLTDLTFTVSKGDLRRAVEIVRPVAQQIGAREVLWDEGLAKVSIVGAGMQSAPGYAATMFRALYEAGINIELITTSEIRITCLIDARRIQDAVQALHRAFQLAEA
jgi:aspartate kinase